MNKDIPLGKLSPAVEQYAPELLFPVERSEGRATLGLVADAMPFVGEDVWHAWELSWLRADGVPEVRVGRLRIACDSPRLIESKSLKLYLNSLNQARFDSEQALLKTIATDLAAVAGAAVAVELLPLDCATLQASALPGTCIDALTPTVLADQPHADLLQFTASHGEDTWHSHLLRSLCPVTGQPDWGSVVVQCSGCRLDAASLLSYVLSYRQHREFHEQCVERMFCDLMRRCNPRSLSVQALYTRRGGLDINPWRSTESATGPCRRSTRQ